MASATLGTGSIQWAIAGGASGTYATSGMFLDVCSFGATRQEVEDITSNGVDGYGTKRYGARDAKIALTVVSVCATETACITGIVDRVSALAASGAISCTVAGQAFVGRILAEETTTSQARSTGLGTYRATATVVIRKLRS